MACIQCLQLRFQTNKIKIQTTSGPIFSKIRTIFFKNPDSVEKSRLSRTFIVKMTLADSFKRCQKKPMSYVILVIFWKIRTFDKIPDEIRTSLTKKVWIRTKVRNYGPSWRHCRGLDRQVTGTDRCNSVNIYCWSWANLASFCWVWSSASFGPADLESLSEYTTTETQLLWWWFGWYLKSWADLD